MRQQTLDTCFNIWTQNAFQSLLAAFLHLSLLTFHTHLTILSSHYSPVNSHATFCLMCSRRLSTFQLCFKIALLICFVCRVTYELFKTFIGLQSLTQHIFRTVLTVVTWSVSTPCARTTKGTEVMSNSLHWAVPAHLCAWVWIHFLFSLPSISAQVRYLFSFIHAGSSGLDLGVCLGGRVGSQLVSLIR